MNYTNKVMILKILLVMTALMIVNTNSVAIWFCNNTDGVFKNNGNGISASTDLIEQYIAEGAGYFLDSYSCTLQFMRKVELAINRELNYPELNQLLDSALTNMEQARATYKLLKETADQTSYNPAVIDALKNFNYDLYCYSNGLNREIFNGVKSYLIRGQVREIYGKLLSDMGTIIDLLQTVKKNIDNNLFPPVGTVRQLNQTFSTSLLFGQYVAGVFEAL
jgi:lipopolysaccharide export LptBFGC system permease protein LptF